jgi:hypothetical protein
MHWFIRGSEFQWSGSLTEGVTKIPMPPAPLNYSSWNFSCSIQTGHKDIGSDKHGLKSTDYRLQWKHDWTQGYKIDRYALPLWNHRFERNHSMVNREFITVFGSGWGVTEFQQIDSLKSLKEPHLSFWSFCKSPFRRKLHVFVASTACAVK